MALATSDSTTYTGAIPAPLEQVFAVLSDPAKMPQWLQGCKAVSPTDPVQKGTRLTVEFARGTTEFVITDFSPPESIGWMEQGARQGSKTLFKLEFAGSVTNVTMRQLWTPRTLQAWVTGTVLRRRSAKRMFETAMAEVRRLLGR